MTHAIQPFHLVWCKYSNEPYDLVNKEYYSDDFLGFVQLASMPSYYGRLEEGSSRIDRDIERRTLPAIESEAKAGSPG